MTSTRPTAPIGKSGDPLVSIPHKHISTHTHYRNHQLPSPISPSTQSSPPTSPPGFASTQTANAKATPSAQQNTNLVPIKGFVHEVLRRSRTSGSVLQTALCYLEAIRAKVPELVQKEKSGEGVNGELDLSGRITQGDLEAEEWRELALDSIMADFIHLDAAVESEAASQSDSMATVKVVDGDEAPMSVLSSSFTSSQVLNTGSDPSMAGLKSHLAQNIAKKHKVPSPPLPPLAPLPSPLLCPRRTFLASLILASKFTQDRCYSNKAWAKLSGLPPREIGRCERALGEALEWRLWVGKSPAGPTTSAPSHRPVVRSKSDGELFSVSGSNDKFSTMMVTGSSTPLSNSLRRVATIPTSGICQDPFIPAPAAMELAWDRISWTPPSTSFGTRDLSSVSSDSPPTPPLSFSPTSTESSSGDRTIHMSGFLTPSPGQFAPFGNAELKTMNINAPAYAAQPSVMLDGAGFALSQGYGQQQAIQGPFVYDNTLAETQYQQWTL